METPLSIQPNDFLKKAAHTAFYYGFSPLEGVLKSAKFKKRQTGVQPNSIVETKKDFFSKQLADVLQTCVEHKLTASTRPHLLYHGSLHPDTKHTPGNKTTNLYFGLTVLGIPQSIAEALVLKTARTILEDCGYDKQCIYVNSIGDRDSAQKFSHELTLHIKRQLNNLSAYERQVLKKDVFLVLENLDVGEHPAWEEMPRSMEFLSDKSRKHLRDVLEHLETFDIPYEIDDRLIRNKKFYKDSIFEIRTAHNAENASPVVLACGGRCDEMARRLYRLDMPVTGIVLSCRWKGRKTKTLFSGKKPRRPKFFFIQFGAGAKLKSLALIELLRKTNIPLYQSLGEDSLTEQLKEAKETKIPYALIMGQKEALERSVIVRNMDTQAQETIAHDVLPEYLKKLVR